MTKLIDLTNIDRIEFEMLRIYFSIEDGEPAPERESVLKTLVVNASLLAAVVDDPGKKSKLGMEGLDAPRRHQRKIVAGCRSLTGKLLKFEPVQYEALMHFVGLSNRLFNERGEVGVSEVFGLFNKPIAVELDDLIPTRPKDPDHHYNAEVMDRFAEHLQTMAKR